MNAICLLEYYSEFSRYYRNHLYEKSNLVIFEYPLCLQFPQQTFKYKFLVVEILAIDS